MTSYDTRLCCTVVVRCIGHKRDIPRPLDRSRQGSLVLGARSGSSTRVYLAALRDIPVQPAHVLVIHVGHLIRAERADLPTRNVAPTETSRSTLPILSTLLAWPTVLTRLRRCGVGLLAFGCFLCQLTNSPVLWLPRKAGHPGSCLPSRCRPHLRPSARSACGFRA